MKIIRPIEKKDQISFESFAFATGIGLTSMPKDPSLLEKKIQRSLVAFSNKSFDNQLYIFVLEDMQTKEIHGTCSIHSGRKEEPLYYYKREMITCSALGSSSQIPILKVVSYHQGPSELLGLYMEPNLRKGGYGRLLSLSRLLFMANFPERFASKVKAEIRGFIDENQLCLFWEGIGQHFCHLPINKVLDMASHSRKFAKEVLPEYPIYISLLPREVQTVIGAPHPHAIPAMKMLMNEGFKEAPEIDIFDGGPILEAEVQKLRIIKQSFVGRLAKVSTEALESDDYLLSNTQLPFRACMAQMHSDQEEVVVDEMVAEALQVKVGDTVRFAKAR